MEEGRRIDDPVWAAAVPVADLRKRLDPPPGAGFERDTSNVRGAAIDGLRELAEALDWRPRVDHAFAPDLAFALALDKQDCSERLLAMVCRAYARASQYAAIYFEKEAARRNAERLERALRKSVQAHRDQMDSAISLVEAFRYESTEERLLRRAVADDAYVLTWEIADHLGRIAQGNPTNIQQPLFVFMLRLSHLLVLSSTTKVYFHDEGQKNTHWRRYIKYSLESVDIAPTEKLDTLFRRLGLKGEYSTEDNVFLARHVDELTQLAGDLSRSGRHSMQLLHSGLLPVTGIEHDFKAMPLAPASWEEQSLPST